MLAIVAGSLDKERVENSVSRKVGGLNDLLYWLSAEFIEEAGSLIRGDRELAHSVPVIHSILKEQHRQDGHRPSGMGASS